jgi:hypothetical protein
MFGFLPSPLACCGATASVYRAHFCGLACRLGKDYGPWARCLVNRDSAALAVLGTSVQADPPRSRAATCCNPFASPRALFDDEPVMRFTAAVTVCALGAKLDDDRKDERGLRRCLSGLAAAGIEDAVGRALGILRARSFPVEQVRAALQPPGGSDFEATGRAFGEIAAHLLTGAWPEDERESETRRLLRQVGASLGSLIHAKDAWDDWESDRRHGRPNPLQDIASPRERRLRLRPLVATEVGRMEQAIAALPVRRHHRLVRAVWVDSVRERVDVWLAAGTAGTRRATRRKAREEREGKRKGERPWCRCCEYVDCSNGCDCWCRGSRGASTTGCDPCPCDGNGCGCECCGCDCGC